MNKVIKDQLSKVRSTTINYDNNSTDIFIPKMTRVIPQALNVGDIYLIKVDDSVIHPASNSTLASNWNAGNIPKYSIYQAELVDKMGKMYKFNGIAVEDGKPLYSENWFGWFPENGFYVINKL